MSGWAAEPQVQPSARTGGMVVAGMGRRVGAWIIDALLSGFLSLIPVFVALVSGAVSINERALDSLSNYPSLPVNEPLLSVKMSGLVAAAALYVLLQFGYYAGCWWAMRGTVGQRLLSLQVARIEGPENLPLSRAALRWLVVSGIGTIVGVVVLVMTLNLMATVPFSQTSYATSSSMLSSGTIDPQMRRLDTMSSVASWGSNLWLIILLVSTGMHAMKRGLHDRLAGSIVLGQAPVVPQWGGYPQWGAGGGGGTGYQGWSASGSYQPGYPPAYSQPGYPQPGYPPGSWPQTVPGNPPQSGAPSGNVPPPDGPSA